MRLARRVLATTVAALALAAGGVVVAGPAAATPEDGKGCVGTPSVPDSYICVISTNPAAVTPTVTTTPVYVTVPKVCYFLDCTAAQTVAVPVPGVTPGSGLVAVLWYKGQYIPVSVGTPTVMKVITDTVNLANEKLYGTVLPAVYNVLDTLPTVDEVVYAANERINWALMVADPYLQRVWEEYYAVWTTYYQLIDYINYVVNNPYELLYGLPYWDSVVELVRNAYCYAQQTLDPYTYCY